MRAPSVLHLLRSRHALSLALCAGVIALAGCPKMPRISTITPSPGATPSATPKASPSPSPTPTPTPAVSPSPNEEPASFFLTVGNSPQAVAINSATGKGYVALADDLLYIEQANGDLQSAKVTSIKNSETFPVGSPTSILMVGNATWYADKSLKLIREFSEISMENLGKKDFPFGDSPSRLLKDRFSNDLWIMDPDGRKVANLREAPLENSDAPFPVTLSGIPSDMLLDHAGTGWVLTSENTIVNLVSVQKNGTGATLTFPSLGPEIRLANLKSGAGLAVDSQNHIWVTGVSTEGAGMIIELVPSGESTLTPRTPFPLSFTPGRFVIRGAFAWILDASETATAIYKVSLSEGTIIKDYQLGGRAADLFVDGAGDLWLPIVSQSKVVKLDF